MPNWCNNTLTLTHEDPAMITRAKEALDRGEFLQEFIPVPKDLSDTVSGYMGDGEEQAKLVAKTQANIEKYGYGNWYDFCVGEWGTKWDVGGDGQTDIHPDGKMLHTTFDSAWAPPINAYDKLVELGFGVNAMYYEGGMCYAGAYDEHGDQEISLEGMSADEIERDYPSIDEAFGISESIREYEAENEEELTEWIKDGKEANDKLGLVQNENI
jgi:hypothetical protein